jgi:hypothetical protein
MTLRRQEMVEKLVASIGDKALIVHAPDSEHLDLSGQDIDTLVESIDPLWPLRLDDGWRLCQRVQYDLRGWWWVIERNGDLIAVDTLEDPLGLGRDALRTADVLAKHRGEADPPLRAAYLTAKRIRKSDLSNGEWNRVRLLANENAKAFTAALNDFLGTELARLLTPYGLRGVPPDQDTLARARKLLRARRLGSPKRTLAALGRGVQRYVTRVRQPSGLFVLVCGPDGSGKSSIAEKLPALCEGMFRRKAWFHWRPGVLPQAGALLSRTSGDPSKPHSKPPKGHVPSIASLIYYWLDWLLGGWFRIWVLRARAGLVVVERGWWDIGVDSRRYRLKAPPWMVRALGFFVPRPDLALILEAPTGVLLKRKAEISPEELARQTTVWSSALPRKVKAAHLDASVGLEDMFRRVRELVIASLEARAVSRLGAGWSVLSWQGSPRWWIPRGPRNYAAGGLGIYQPVTFRGRIGWEAARLLAGIGGFRLLPRGEAPPRAVREVLSSYIPPRGTVAVTRGRFPDRYVALILDETGTGSAVAKVASAAPAVAALDREATSIQSLGRYLTSAVSAPEVIASQPGLLLIRAERWELRRQPWILDEEVARALGLFFRGGARHERDQLVGPTHGDVAPWNLLSTERGWVLVDWESAAEDGPPFYDLCHYIVQAYSLLGRPSLRSVVSGFSRGEGWIGRAIEAYAEGAGISPAEAASFLESYLRSSGNRLLVRSRRDRLALTARERLLQQIGG